MSVEPIKQGITSETLKNWRVAELARERDEVEAVVATED